MRALLIPAALAAVFAASPMAFAATQSTTGQVKAFNHKAMTLTLKDGSVYSLPASFKDPGLKAGEKVKVSWEMIKGKHEASAVTITN